ncbi:uncharacterized protein BJ171DRAFT_437687 [Polychytrium aggregatum]|uniref:uncharacterized protein n=1 Tax=Polychytrium aggregatum TaxID=110093 RepID=UPI0022FDD1D1|nr:uncharacterized protein BJ171DRAFT_437687 [Polychytrium aggregatum]KAI9208957.1 hypothetical protein BJ171DRAFT_437687 [Polychytrium aggregatum]
MLVPKRSSLLRPVALRAHVGCAATPLPLAVRPALAQPKPESSLRAPRLSIQPCQLRLLHITPRCLRQSADSDGVDTDSLEAGINIGDLVEVRRGGKSFLGIIMKLPGARGSGENDYQTVVEHFHWISHSEAQISFRIPGWAFSKIVQRATEKGESVLPQYQSSLSRSGNLFDLTGVPPIAVQHLDRFKEAAESYRFSKVQRMNQLYSAIVKKRTTITLVEAAQWIYYNGEDGTSPTSAELYATFLYLLKNSVQFSPVDPWAIGLTPEFRVRDPEEVQKIDWLRKQISSQRQGSAFESFIAKARTLIDWSRSRDGGSNAPPETPPKVTFSSDDQVFIDAVKTYISLSAHLPSVYETIVLSGIIKELQPLYRYRSNKQDAILLLKEIGVWTPWENTRIYIGGKRGVVETLEGHGLASWADDVAREGERYGDLLLTQPHVEFDAAGKQIVPTDSASQLAKKTDKSPSENEPASDRQHILNTIRNLTVSPKVDETDRFFDVEPCAHLRRDFGSTPVYVIDDPTAHELDDGMSVEETPQGTWLHVHIADPTAYIPVSHPISLIAQLRANSVYLPERHYPMMPDILSEERFNLGKSQCAMTFSALIGEDGQIRDYKVQPSIIRNPKIVHYDDVDTVLNWDQIYATDRNPSTLSPWARLALKRRDLPRDPRFDSQAVKDLQAIQRLAGAHLKHRIKMGKLAADQPDISVRVEEYPLPKAPLNSPTPFWPDVQPEIVVNANKAAHISPAHVMVSESMVVAGRIAAKFCADRHIPVIYRGQRSMLAQAQDARDRKGWRAADQYPPDSVLVSLLDRVRSQTCDRSGIAPFITFFELLAFMPAAQASLEPLGHFTMGIPGPGALNGYEKDGFVGYVKVTSPLRRYKDMIAHWQMKAWLLRDRPAGISSVGSGVAVADPTGTLPYPFTVEAMTELLGRLHHAQKRTDYVSSKSERYWLMEWMRRRQKLWLSGSPGDTVNSATMPYVPPTSFHDRLGHYERPQESALLPAAAGLEPVYQALVLPSGGQKRPRVLLADLGGEEARLGVPVDAAPGSYIDVVVSKLDFSGSYIEVIPKAAVL